MATKLVPAAPRPISVKPAVAATMLGVSESTIRNLIQRGAIRPIYFGESRRTLIPVSELDNWVETLKREQWNVVVGRG